MRLASLKSPLLLLITSILISTSVTKVAATCGDTQNAKTPHETYGGEGACGTNFTKSLHWTVSWTDGYDRDVTVTDAGTPHWGQF